MNEPTQSNLSKAGIFLSSGIRASSAISELLSLETINELLNSYYNTSYQILNENGAVFAKASGNGWIAGFSKEQPADALTAALQILRTLKMTRDRSLKNEAAGILYAGIGISSGKITECRMQTKEHSEFIYLGKCVKTASRLQSITQKARKALLFDEDFKKKLPVDFPVIFAGKYRSEGKTNTVDIFSFDDPSVLDYADSQLLGEMLEKFGK